MIEVRGVTKRFKDTVAVDDLSFDVKPGQVTGFLGPNGSGKSTTMRIIMGLDAADSGTATVNGRRFHDLPLPLREVGALLEARAIHPGRSAFNHLWYLARSNDIPRRRVLQVLEMVGLETVARKRAGKFSLGMGQRLGIAAALLGDPEVLLFDEPVNGLDPEGILWVRNLLKGLAAEGRTVFVSSHLMSEMALTADQIVVIGKGKLISAGSTAAFIAESSAQFVRVRSPQIDRLQALLIAEGGGRAARVRRRARRFRPRRAPDRRPRRRGWHLPARARHPVGLARRGVHGVHARERGVPRAADRDRRLRPRSWVPVHGGIMTVALPTPTDRALAEGRHVRVPSVLASEWIKLRSVRSTGWSIFAMALITIGVAVIAGITVTHQWNTFSLPERLTFDPTGLSLRGLLFSELVIGVLGVLVITAEYGTVTIRATFSAVPHRILVLAAKAAVFAALAWSWARSSRSARSSWARRSCRVPRPTPR